MSTDVEREAEDIVQKALPPASIPGVPPARLNGVRSSQQIIGGRDAAAALTGLYNNYAPLAYMLPFQSLDYIEMIAQYNPDFSQAVDNIVTLANSGYNLVVTGNKRTAQRTHDAIQFKSLTVMEEHGGFEGLIDKLLHQGAVYGAMCGEWMLSDDLKDVVGFADINPKLIRFFWEENHWAPYQKVGFLQLQDALTSGQKVRSGAYVKLNELTFKYYGFNSAPMSPYGTPPFLAALPGLSTQMDMVFNMAQIVKKIGMLGVVDIVIERLQLLPGETAVEFKNRAGSYVQEYSDAMEDMMSQGGIAHFDDATVKVTNPIGNAAGATAIFKQNEELVFSGLKSMPSVQGRSYSTTETYAGVAYDIIIRNTRKYQDAVRGMMRRGFWLMASVWGETPDAIDLEFLQNKTLQRLEEAKAANLEIINSVMLWVMGIYDQQDVSHTLGHGAPKVALTDAPTNDPIFGAKGGIAGPGTGQEGGDNPTPIGEGGTGKSFQEQKDEMWAEFDTHIDMKFAELTQVST